MFTDMIGYTALGQKDESLSLQLVDEQRRKIRPLLKDHHGREVKTMGDSFLVEFPSALDAVKCACDIQKAIRESNSSIPEQRRVHLRIGVHLGDVVESEGDISGDAVNVASRIEPLAEDGGVCMSRQVYDHVQNKFDLPFQSVGVKTLKNVNTPVEVFKILMPWEAEKPIGSIHLDSKRIAILPFANMSPDPGDSYFADGITEELISTISNISGLQVISRTSVMGYKGATKKIPEIGQELRVGSVLEGSVRKADSLVRVTAQLIDVNSDRHLWSQSYDRELKNIFALQSEIAKHVADSLRVKILSPETQLLDRTPTENTEAYSLYLKGRSHWAKRGIDDVKKAMQYFELAVQEDPGFALGYVGQADCCIILRENWALDPEGNREKAKARIGTALKLDPGLAEAHASNAMILTQEYRMRLAEEEFRRSTELKPNYATAHQWYSTLLVGMKRWDEAFEQIQKALELDPLSAIMTVNLGFYYVAKREYPKSIEPFKRAIEMGFAPAHMFLGFTYGLMKMFSEMKREFGIFANQVKDIYPFVDKSIEAFIAESKEDNETLRGLLPFLETHIGQTLSDSYQIAGYYFRLGEIDKGFEWLEKSYSKREGSLARMKIDDNLDGIRDDPRYHEMLKRLEMD